jgi:hypothetical protein
VLKVHDANVYFKCFICLRGMLQGFHIDVAYVVMVVHVCCKHLFPMFYLYVASVLI